MVAGRRSFCRILWPLAACVCLAFGLPIFGQNRAGDDMAVIVNSSNTVNDLRSSALRRVFQGEQQHWNSKLPVYPLVHAPGSEERDAELRLLFQMKESEYKKFWMEKTFRGGIVSTPTAVFSDGFAVEAVKAMPGAIACVKMSAIRPGVKVLRIDGSLPGNSDYPLHLH